MGILITVLAVVVIVGLGIYVLGGVGEYRTRGTGRQTADMWYSRFADRGRRGRDSSAARKDHGSLFDRDERS